MGEGQKHRFTSAHAMAAAALFISLSGSAMAVTVAQNTVRSKSVKDNSIQARDLKDGKAVGSPEVIDNSLTGTDINEATLNIPASPASLPPSGAAGGALSGAYPNPLIAANAVGSPEIADDAVGTSELAANAVNTADIADNAINAAKIAPEAVGTSEVASNSLTAADLNSGSVGSDEIATGSVQDDEVSAGTLNADDVASNTGSISYDPPPLAAGACDSTVVTVDANTIDDIIVLTPDSSVNPLAAAGRLTYWPQQSTNNTDFRLNVCNISNADIADGAIPTHNVFYMVFDRGVGA